MTKKVSVDSVITNAKIVLRKIKIQFPEKLIIAHLNINSIRNKFDSLSFMILEIHIRDDIPTKLLKHDFGTNIENLSVEIDLRRRKWFFNGSYNPHKSKILNLPNYLNLVFNKYGKVYDNFIFMGDFSEQS